MAEEFSYGSEYKDHSHSTLGSCNQCPPFYPEDYTVPSYRIHAVLVDVGGGVICATVFFFFQLGFLSKGHCGGGRICQQLPVHWVWHVLVHIFLWSQKICD